MIVPAPVQAAMTAAFSDDEHAVEQRAGTERGVACWQRGWPPPVSASTIPKPG